jgi:inner membrane protein
MPSIITHAAVPLMLGAASGQRYISHRLLVTGAIAAILPDIDTLGYALGVSYSSLWGHRGITHSIAFAVLLALIAAINYKRLQSTVWRCALFVGLAVFSHPLLDMCTNNGKGVLLLWPLSDHRWFFPDHPIVTSPIGIARFLQRAQVVLTSEFYWVWLPVALCALFLWLGRYVERSGRGRK